MCHAQRLARIKNRSGGLPGHIISGFQTIGQTAQTPDENHTASYQEEEILTWVKGTHTLKFGARYIRHDFNGFSAISPRGTFSYSTQFTRQIGTSSGGSALADFALGAYFSATRSVQSGVFGMRMWETGFFAQDDWRVTNRLTLSYGLRHEMQSPPFEVNDQWANFDLASGKWRLPGVNGNNRSLRNLYTRGFAPRVGIAYLLTKDSKTVLRENPVHVHDLHATTLHLLGLNHEKLTFKYSGRNFRLTDVAGRVVKELMA